MRGLRNDVVVVDEEPSLLFLVQSACQFFAYKNRLRLRIVRSGKRLLGRADDVRTERRERLRKPSREDRDIAGTDARRERCSSDDFEPTAGEGRLPVTRRRDQENRLRRRLFEQLQQAGTLDDAALARDLRVGFCLPCHSFSLQPR